MVYVDDIVITGNDTTKIVQLKEHLFSHFQTKDLGHLKYFLGIEVAQSEDGFMISQRKYALDILEEIGMQNCRPVDSLMDPNMKLMADQSEAHLDPERYRRLVGKLIYLTITRLDISFSFGVVSQFMHNPHVDHWNVVMHILRYIKRAPGQGLLYEDKGNTQLSGYYDADWVVVLWIGDLHQVIVSSLEGILFLGRARSKLLLLGLVQKLNINPWLWLHVSSCGLNNFPKN